MELLLTLVAGVALTTLALLGLTVWAVRAMLRRVRRALTPTHGQRLRVQALRPGSGRPVAVVRRQLHDDVTATQRALALGRADGRPVDGLLPSARALTHAAAALDLDLVMVGADPDPGRRALLLAQLRHRVEAVRSGCAELRRGVQVAGTLASAPPLTATLAELADEVARLDLWAQAHRELSRPTAAGV